MFDSLAVGKKQAIISEEKASKMEGDGNNTSKYESSGIRSDDRILESANGVAPKRGMVLPFRPLAMSFDCVNYYVDMPAVRTSSSYIAFSI